MDNKNYISSIKSKFWAKVFAEETNYLSKELNGKKDILSVGCGPANVEGMLAEKGFNLTGLDISEEFLKYAPDNIKCIVGSAEKTSFPNESFDGIIFIVSLQFIDDYQKALAEAQRILKPDGTLVILLLNPLSNFFKKRHERPDSYVRNIKHRDLEKIVEDVSQFFTIIKKEYFLGIKDEELFNSRDPNVASLYCITAKSLS